MKLLKKLYQIPSHSGDERKMREFLLGHIASMGIQAKIDNIGNIYACKGVADTYPCVVAHMDEVHSKRGKYSIVHLDDIIFGFSTKQKKQVGIGADDKNGLWVALKCLEMFEAIKVAFFVGEEIGCVGSRDADMSFFSDCRFVLQCDRRGDSDFITSIGYQELCSQEFIRDCNISHFGYSENHGMMTDVEELKSRGLAVSCCNISCGYYDPHYDTEYTVVSDLLNCLELVKYIITNCTGVYPHKHSYGFGKYKYGCDYNSDLYDWCDATTKKKTDKNWDEWEIEYNDACDFVYQFENYDDFAGCCKDIYSNLSEDDIREIHAYAWGV